MSSDVAPFRVVLFGGDSGNRNLGDQAMLLATVGRLHRHFPNCAMTVLAANPDLVPDLAGVHRVSWPPGVFAATTRCSRWRIPGLWRFWRLPTLARGRRLVQAARAMRRGDGRCVGTASGTAELLRILQGADLVLNFGSGALNDLWAKEVVYPWSFCYLAARELGKRVLVTGQGIGPLTHPIDRWLLCMALDRVDAITLRDRRESWDLLRRGGVRHPMTRETADDAAELAAARADVVWRALGEEGVSVIRPLVAVNVRRTGYDDVLGQRELALIAAAVDRLVQESGAEVIFVSMSYNDEVDDRVSARAVVAKMQHAYRAIVLQRMYDPVMTKGFIAEADLAIGMSYHFLMFALTAGTPAVGLFKGPYYARKLQGLMGHFALEGSALDLNTCSVEVVVRQALTALCSRGPLREQLTATSARLQTALDDVWREVGTWFADEKR
jgi:polysaccharide pyruvyl transferase WcaK-like protein